MSYIIGTHLKVTPGTTSGGVDPLTTTYQWKLDGSNVFGAISSNYITVSAGSLTCVQVVTDNDGNIISSESPSVDIVSSDSTAPTLVSSSVNGATLTLNWSETVTGSGAYLAAMNVDLSTTGSNIGMIHTSGNGTSTWIMTLSSPAIHGETADFDFVGGSNLIQDGAGNDLVSITSASVTNNTSAGSFDPLTLSPTIWVDGADSSTLLDASDSPASNGTAVKTWTDKSGNVRNLINSSSGSRPIRRVGITTSGSVLEFDGSDDYLVTENNATTTSSTTRFVVVAPRNVSVGGVIISNALFYDNPAGNRELASSSGGKITIVHNGGTGTTLLAAKESTATLLANNIFSVITQRTDGTNAGQRLWFNGVEITSVDNATYHADPGLQSTDMKAAIGGRVNGTFPCACYIAEVLVYPTTLSDSDLNDVNTYLQNKWLA